MSSRDVLGRYRASRAKPAIDPNDVCFELYNPGDEEITFTSVHPKRYLHNFFGKPASYWLKFTVKPGEWVFLPHGHYVGTVPSGNQEIRVIKNYGDAIGIGNKLPSRPESQKTRFFT